MSAMSGLIGRELTIRERVVAGLLQTALTRLTHNSEICNALSRIAARSPEGFCAAALSLLEAAQEPSVRKKISQHLLECPEFLVRLMQPGAFNRSQLVEICRELM